MGKRFDPPAGTCAAVPAVPGWAVPRGMVESDAEAAFMAGGALNSLDNLVCGAPAWGGAWRYRLALGAAAACVRLGGRREDEAALRDAWVLRQPGDAPGPAGSVLAAWRRLAGRASIPDEDALGAIAGLLGLDGRDAPGDLVDTARELARSSLPAPLVAARVAGAVVVANPKAEPLAWWLADLALSLRMRWPLPVPLLATQIHAPLLRAGPDRVRARPGREGFERAACVALAAGAAEACRLGAAMDAQARRLLEVAPALRSKGAGEVIALLLADDAVPGSLTTGTVSRWASRRLFDRLVRLGAVRELSGRDSFRIFGL